MSKKRREQLKEQFLFAIPPTQGDVGFVDIVQANNINIFSTKLSYIAAAVSGGKMKCKDAEQRVKDLYKVWKSSNKSLDDSWK